MDINTYPEMNETIKGILRIGSEPHQLYAAARIEELEAEVAKLSAFPAAIESAGRIGGDEPYSNYGQGWKDAVDCIRTLSQPTAEGGATRFQAIQSCQSPEDMAVMLNGNARRFCPKEYSSKPDTCAVPCGRCITEWLREEAGLHV